MSSNLVITAADTSGRWYLLPGSPNAYELTVANESDHSVLCKLSLDDPADAGTVTPATATLKAGESRVVSVSFKPEWLSLRDRKAVVTARDAAGAVLATFVHDLVAATSTDCSVSLGWKEEIAGDGMLRGFTLSCSIRSISSTPGVFEPEFSQHPSLRLPEKHRITLGPGETSTFDVPIVWNRSARDNEGWNHPRTIEVGVPVTHGRRTASAPWDLVQQHIEPYLTDADRAPVIVRRPPPPQFTQPGGGAAAPAISPLAVAPRPEPVLAAPANETPAERIERAELESGVASIGMRLPATPVVHPPEPKKQVETIAVAPATLWLIALGIGAIAIVLVWMLRVPSNTSAVSTAPVQVASAPLPSALPAHVKRQPARKNPHPSKKQASATPAQVAASDAGGSTVAPQPQTQATQAPTAPSRQGGTSSHAHAAAALPQRNSPIDRQALVQLNSVSAEYLRGGRQLHVYWDSYAQARADVQVLDARNTIVAETTVGRRMAALLSLPRGYRGGVYVQVTAIGYDGERVVDSTSLGPP